jgi:hypothetical protein
VRGLRKQLKDWKRGMRMRRWEVEQNAESVAAFPQELEGALCWHLLHSLCCCPYYKFQMRPWAHWPWTILDSQIEPAKLKLDPSKKGTALVDSYCPLASGCLIAPSWHVLPLSCGAWWLTPCFWAAEPQEGVPGCRAADVIWIGQEIQAWRQAAVSFQWVLLTGRDLRGTWRTPAHYCSLSLKTNH